MFKWLFSDSEPVDLPFAYDYEREDAEISQMVDSWMIEFNEPEPNQGFGLPPVQGFGTGYSKQGRDYKVTPTSDWLQLRSVEMKEKRARFSQK